MTIAIIVVVCVVLLVLAFLMPRLSSHPQRGVDRTLGVGLLEHLRELNAVNGVLRGPEHVVRELADVLDEAHALIPQEPGVGHDLLGVRVRLLAQQLRLALGTLEAPVRLRP